MRGYTAILPRRRGPGARGGLLAATAIAVVRRCGAGARLRRLRAVAALAGSAGRGRRAGAADRHRRRAVPRSAGRHPRRKCSAAPARRSASISCTCGRAWTPPPLPKATPRGAPRRRTDGCSSTSPPTPTTMTPVERLKTIYPRYTANRSQRPAPPAYGAIAFATTRPIAARTCSSMPRRRIVSSCAARATPVRRPARASTSAFSDRPTSRCVSRARGLPIGGTLLTASTS